MTRVQCSIISGLLQLAIISSVCIFNNTYAATEICVLSRNYFLTRLIQFQYISLIPIEINRRYIHVCAHYKLNIIQIEMEKVELYKRIIYLTLCIINFIGNTFISHFVTCMTIYEYVLPGIDYLKTYNIILKRNACNLKQLLYFDLF